MTEHRLNGPESHDHVQYGEVRFPSKVLHGASLRASWDKLLSYKCRLLLVRVTPLVA